MGRGFCPKCGVYSLAFDPESKRVRCYNLKCTFKVEKHVYNQILPNTTELEMEHSSNLDKITNYFGGKPSKAKNSIGLENITA